MKIRDVAISANTASGNDADQGGGGLFNDGGTMIVVPSRITNDVADGTSGSGGGILNDQGTLTVINTRLANNTSNRAGGGIEANVGSTDLDRVNLVRNSTGNAPGNGGGLWNSATDTMTVRNTTIRRNQAPSGPDVFNDGGTFTVDGTPVPVD